MSLPAWPRHGRRVPLRAVGLALGIALVGCGAPPPNVLLIVADDLSWDHYGFAGHPVLRTPNLDALAAESVRFENAYTSSTCRPSLATLLTGQPEHVHGVRYTFGPPLPDQTSLADRLGDAGYATYQAGKFWEGDPSAWGFTAARDEFVDLTDLAATILALAGADRGGLPGRDLLSGPLSPAPVFGSRNQGRFAASALHERWARSGPWKLIDSEFEADQLHRLPDEDTNWIDTPQGAPVAAELRSRLETWWQPARSAPARATGGR